MATKILGLPFDLNGPAVHPVGNATGADLTAARSALTAGRVVLRSGSAVGPHYLGPYSPDADAATRSTAIQTTLGPFEDDADQIYWADVVTAVQPQVAVLTAGVAQPWLTAPLTANPANPQQLLMGAGSLWIAANAFDSKAPQGFVGLTVSGGSLTASLPLPIVNNGVLLLPGETVTIHAQLQNPTNTSTANGPGADLGSAKINLPATFDATLVNEY